MAEAVKLSHLDQVMFPETQYTKGDVIGHYRLVAQRMVPHMRDRPAALARFPDGIDGLSFCEQTVAPHTPSWIETVTLNGGESGGKATHLLCQDEQTLVYLANQAAITLYTWLSTADHPDRPDQLLFDLDPAHEFGEARHAALDMRELLTELGLPSVVKTTGGRGLHVSVPIQPRYPADELRDFARTVCSVLESRAPELYTSEVHKNKSEGRLFLGVSRNSFGQPAVAPYAVRATRDARVATPLDWTELEDEALSPTRFTIDSIPKRLAEPDPWRELPEPAASLATARQRIGDLPF
jgi:bifunctional non-homologous end joining protein LigD